MAIDKLVTMNGLTTYTTELKKYLNSNYYTKSEINDKLSLASLQRTLESKFLLITTAQGLYVSKTQPNTIASNNTFTGVNLLTTEIAEDADPKVVVNKEYVDKLKSLSLITAEVVDEKIDTSIQELNNTISTTYAEKTYVDAAVQQAITNVLTEEF